MTSAASAEGSTLRPLTAAEYAEWVEQSIVDHAADKVAAGQWTPDESLELSRQENQALLPPGLDTPGNHFFAIVDSQAIAVGMLHGACVFDVSIRPDRQREGHAARAFRAVEAEVRRLGLSGIALHVFGHNDAAGALYTKLGFRPTNISLYKPIDPPAA